MNLYQFRRLHKLYSRIYQNILFLFSMSQASALAAVKALQDGGAQLSPLTAAAYALGFVAGAAGPAEMTLSSLLDTAATANLLGEGGMERATALEKAALFAEVSGPPPPPPPHTHPPPIVLCAC